MMLFYAAVFALTLVVAGTIMNYLQNAWVFVMYAQGSCDIQSVVFDMCKQAGAVVP